MIEYRTLCEDEIDRELFHSFVRRQVVVQCWRRQDGAWVLRDDPFIDDWSEADYQTLVTCLRGTLAGAGLVLAAFDHGALKGFASVEGALFGGEEGYLDLTSLHVSADYRGRGIGRVLFRLAQAWARGRGAKKLYISAHSAAETQAFYRAMGCVEARRSCPAHTEAEPLDCQLERAL